jgi:hypothetical protein
VAAAAARAAGDAVRALACGVAVLAALVAGAASTAAIHSSIDLPTVAAKQIRIIDRKTEVPILLPTRLPWTGRVPRLYPVSWTTPRGWGLALDAAPQCGGANACFVASFEATHAGRLPAPSNLRLAGGQRAFYLPIRCGASCAPASIWFVHERVLYAWQLKEPPKGGRAALALLAASAIDFGPR